MSTRQMRLRGHGKVILFGEHAVVYGHPGLAVPVLDAVVVLETERSAKWSVRCSAPPVHATESDDGDLGRSLQALRRVVRGAEPLSVHVDCRIPLGAGLGGSAALSTAIARSAGLVDDRLFEAVQAMEKVFHDNPSGIDATIAIHGCPCLFRRGGLHRAPAGVVAQRLSQSALAVPLPPLRLAVGLSGVPRKTADMVRRVADFTRDAPARASRTLERIGQIAVRGVRAAQAGDLRTLGKLMTENHEALVRLGVSHAALDSMVEIALGAGALGAKLTGAGGGGCAIALCEELSRVLSAWRKAGFEGFLVEPGSDKDEGVAG